MMNGTFFKMLLCKRGLIIDCFHLCSFGCFRPFFLWQQFSDSKRCFGFDDPATNFSADSDWVKLLHWVGLWFSVSRCSIYVGWVQFSVSGSARLVPL